MTCHHFSSLQPNISAHRMPWRLHQRTHSSNLEVPNLPSHRTVITFPGIASPVMSNDNYWPHNWLHNERVMTIKSPVITTRLKFMEHCSAALRCKGARKWLQKKWQNSWGKIASITLNWALICAENEEKRTWLRNGNARFKVKTRRKMLHTLESRAKNLFVEARRASLVTHTVLKAGPPKGGGARGICTQALGHR